VGEKFSGNFPEFIADSSLLASVVGSYIQVEARKPASIYTWALERDGQSQ